MSLVDEMGELVGAECHRQGAWGLLGEGTGAKLLCPNTGTVLTKDDIFGKFRSPVKEDDMTVKYFLNHGIIFQL